MANRVLFVCLSLFWLTMNLWLWRSEFGGRRQTGSPVAIERVWRKVLTAPDDSALEILHQGKRVGRCRWVPNVGEEATTGKVSDAALPPEGMVKRTLGYTVDVTDGTLSVPQLGSLLRFNLHGRFSTNHTWQEFALQGAWRPAAYEVRASAPDERISLKVEDENGKWERSYSFAELRSPQVLLRDLAGGSPFLGGAALLGALSSSARLPDARSLSLGLTWEARNDWLKFGRSPVRVYRLEARLPDRYRVVVYVSRVGEILRMELPNHVTLVNEAMLF